MDRNPYFLFIHDNINNTKEEKKNPSLGKGDVSNQFLHPTQFLEQLEDMVISERRHNIVLHYAVLGRENFRLQVCRQ